MAIQSSRYPDLVKLLKITVAFLAQGTKMLLTSSKRFSAIHLDRIRSEAFYYPMCAGRMSKPQFSF